MTENKTLYSPPAGAASLKPAELRLMDVMNTLLADKHNSCMLGVSDIFQGHIKMSETRLGVRLMREAEVRPVLDSLAEKGLVHTETVPTITSLPSGGTLFSSDTWFMPTERKIADHGETPTPSRAIIYPSRPAYRF